MQDVIEAFQFITESVSTLPITQKHSNRFQRMSRQWKDGPPIAFYDHGETYAERNSPVRKRACLLSYFSHLKTVILSTLRI